MERNSTQVLAPSQHLTLGGYLIASGFAGGLMNVAGILMFARFPKVLWNPSAIPEIGLLLSDLCVAGLHPFSGSSALMNRWLWGPIGCQLYSVSGFLFGSFQLCVVPFIAFDRFLTTCKPSWEARYRNYKTYTKIFVALFFISLYFSIMPAIGWASYGVTPVHVACTIDWMRPDTAYTSFMTTYTLFCYVVPLGITLLLYLLTVSAIKSGTASTYHWTAKDSATFVSLGCALTVFVAFAGYAIVCIWAMITDPRTIPSGFNILPPPMAKMAGLIHPFFYVYCNPLHWACMRTMLGCCAAGDAARILEEAAADQAKREEVQLTARSGGRSAETSTKKLEDAGEILLG